MALPPLFGNLVVVGNDGGMGFLGVHHSDFAVDRAVVRDPFRDRLRGLAHLIEGAVNQVPNLLFVEPLPDSLGGHDGRSRRCHGVSFFSSLGSIRSRPICSISPAAFITLSTLMFGTSSFLLEVAGQVLLGRIVDADPGADQVGDGLRLELLSLPVQAAPVGPPLRIRRSQVTAVEVRKLMHDGRILASLLAPWLNSMS